MSKNWSPADLRGTKRLLAEGRAIEETRIAKNLASWEPGKYKPGWTYGEGVRDFEIFVLGDKVGDREALRLNPYWLAPDEFETPDDRCWTLLSAVAKDYSDASEGAGQVTVRGSNYDTEEPEVFLPYDATIKYNNSDGGWKLKRRATADEEDTLGFDTESDLVMKMADAFREWAGMTGPPPKAVDPTVADMVESYLANGGEVHTFRAYQTTRCSKIRLKLSFHPEWAGGTGIPPELRKFKKCFRAMPKTGSKLWSLTT